MQAAGPIFNANPDGGVYLISSSIAVRSCDNPYTLPDASRAEQLAEAAWPIR